MNDLFGNPVERQGAMTDAERKRMRRRAAERPRGHAWKPGTGPAGEACGSCTHFVRLHHGFNVYRKCGKNREAWTRSPRTDIRAGDAACKFWERKRND